MGDYKGKACHLDKEQDEKQALKAKAQWSKVKKLKKQPLC